MKLLKMPSGKHQCLVYSLAMLLDEDVDVLIQELGHDGMVRVFNEPVPHCYNGHHIQEIVDLCLMHNYALVPIEVFPRYAAAPNPEEWRALWDPEQAAQRFIGLVRESPGILLSDTHAVAWDGNIIYDPNGRTYELEDFRIAEFWMLLPITSRRENQ